MRYIGRQEERSETHRVQLSMVRAASSAFPQTCGKLRPRGQRQQSRRPRQWAAEPELDEVLTASATLLSKDILQPCARSFNVKWNGCLIQPVSLLRLSCIIFVFSSGLLCHRNTWFQIFDSTCCTWKCHVRSGRSRHFCSLPWLHCRVVSQLCGSLNIYRLASLQHCRVVLFYEPGPIALFIVLWHLTLSKRAARCIWVDHPAEAFRKESPPNLVRERNWFVHFLCRCYMF